MLDYIFVYLGGIFTGLVIGNYYSCVNMKGFAGYNKAKTGVYTINNGVLEKVRNNN